jgi:hypothetical protein
MALRLIIQRRLPQLGGGRFASEYALKHPIDEGTIL